MSVTLLCAPLSKPVNIPFYRMQTNYTVSQKTRHQIFTDFHNSFTVRLSKKFVTKSYLNTQTLAKRVTTLPNEILVFKKSQFLRSK